MQPILSGLYTFIAISIVNLSLVLLVFLCLYLFSRLLFSSNGNNYLINENNNNLDSCVNRNLTSETELSRTKAKKTNNAKPIKTNPEVQRRTNLQITEMEVVVPEVTESMSLLDFDLLSHVNPDEVIVTTDDSDWESGKLSRLMPGRKVEFCHPPSTPALRTNVNTECLLTPQPDTNINNNPEIIRAANGDEFDRPVADFQVANFQVADFKVADFQVDDIQLEGLQISENEFKPATEIFNDTAAWALLEQFGSSKKDKMDSVNLARESLYVRFDPLMKRKSPVSRVTREESETRKVQATSLYEGEGDLLMMDTPPIVRERTSKSAKRRLNTTVQSELDRMFICDLQPDEPIGVGQRFSPPTLDSINNAASFTNPEEIVQVLKYSENDMVKVLMDQQARLLAKERNWDKRENDLTVQVQKEKDRVAKIQQANEDMQKLIGEYERTVSHVISDKAQFTSCREGDLTSALKERDQAQEQLRTMETAFSALHGRYEKAKSGVEILKTNEEELKKYVANCQAKIKKHEQRYDVLKQHAQEKLKSANEEIDKVFKVKNGEVAKAQAAIKRMELQQKTLQTSLDQKIKENKELTSICDELIGKMGGDS